MMSSLVITAHSITDTYGYITVNFLGRARIANAGVGALPDDRDEVVSDG